MTRRRILGRKLTLKVTVEEVPRLNFKGIFAKQRQRNVTYLLL